MRQSDRAVEWPTLLFLGGAYAAWALGTAGLWQVSGVLAVIVTGLAVAQFSSLQHEVLHGHPFRNPHLNHALIFLPVGLLYPYGRFRDTHLAHHFDPNLTDPYDDPESNFQDPEVWARLPGWRQALLRANNTLLGRLVLGTALGAVSFIRADFIAMAKGNRIIQRDWALHVAGLVLLGLWLGLVGTMPIWAYVLAAYIGNSLIKIRTFLEHRAHDAHRARSVVVEDRGPLSWLFLNNNYHVVHHCHPNVPWYDLPGLYRTNRAHFLRRNEGYVYRSYAQIFAQHFLRAKDPVPHPIWPVKKGQPDAADCDLKAAE